MTVAVATGRARAPHTRTIVLGYLTIAFAFTIPLIMSRFTAVFLAPFLAVALLMAALAWRFGTWAKVVATVVAVLMVLMNAPFMVEAVSHPNVFFDFIPSVLVIAGALIAVAGGVVAVMRRRERRVGASASERTVLRASIVAFALVAAISAVLSLVGRTTLSASEKVDATPVGMRNFAYEPAAFEASGASPRIVVHNSDVALHTFSVTALGIDVDVTPGSDAVVQLAGAAPGTYQVYCRPHSGAQPDGTRQGMVATLVVR